MNNYFLKMILLEGCKYSIAAHDLTQTHQLPCQITWINQADKELFKNEKIQTFPQIYLNRFDSKGNLLLGGYDDLKSFYDTFKATKLDDSNINNFMQKSKWSKKSTLRLIQLINNSINT
jgi:hypothetical protein